MTRDNAGRIKARIVTEAANGPVTPMAEEIMAANGTICLPDMLINAGGVTAAIYCPHARRRSPRPARLRERPAPRPGLPPPAGVARTRVQAHPRRADEGRPPE
ncbi:MAG: hypothetical protein ABGY75_14325 [Gemmataceae bacterium]